MSDVQYDKFGRMLYHPEFHPNHGKRLSFEDRAYLCRFWEVDGPKVMSFALGQTEMTLVSKVRNIRKQEMFDYYCKAWERMEAKEA